MASGFFRSHGPYNQTLFRLTKKDHPREGRARIPINVARNACQRRQPRRSTGPRTTEDQSFLAKQADCKTNPSSFECHATPKNAAAAIAT